MPAKAPKLNSNSTKAMDYETLLRRVSERVWELWQEDLRRNRERGSKGQRR